MLSTVRYATGSEPVRSHGPEAIRVFLCDDVPEFRQLMRFALEQDEQMLIAGEAGDGRACVEGVRASQPDVVLLDLSMPARDGLQAIPQIREVAPHCAIVVLSGLGASRMADQAVAAGASGYIEKGESFQGIRAMVREAAHPPVPPAPPSAA